MKTNYQFAKKVIWALDAFHDSPKEQLKTGKTVQLLFKENPVVIQPVSILRLGAYDPVASSFQEKWSDLAKSAHDNLESLLNKSKIPNLKTAHLIKQEGQSVTNSVDTLLAYALEEGADMIFVSSHARKGPVRFFLGSFAETLALRSPLPVLVLNPKVKPSKRLKNILFPTDFSEKSKEAFERTLRLANNLGCHITLFHKLEFLHPDFGYPFVVPPVSKDSISKVSKEYHDLGEAWVTRGRSMNVDVSFYLANKPGYALDEIIKASKRGEGSTMIAMASQSGPVKSVLLGSLTRQVLRNSTCPVLVIHPHQEELVEKVTIQLKNAIQVYSTHPLLT